MEVGHLVRFASQQHPFMMEARPCLDLDCACSIMHLTLTEFDPSGALPRERLTFTLRICLKTWSEQDPPPRSLEVESLARELVACFPSERIKELHKEFQQARTIKRRLSSLRLTGAPTELVTYAEVAGEEGGIREGCTACAFFFVFEGREFLVEDRRNDPCHCGSGLKFKRCCGGKRSRAAR